MDIYTRVAKTHDIQGIFDVRTSVKENHLSREAMQQMGITESFVAEMIEESCCTWVAISNDKVIGFSMILPDEGCLFAVFVLQEYEGKGTGRRLIELAECELFKYYETIWLETDKNTRAAQFYIKNGWIIKSNMSSTDIRLEKYRAV